MRHLALILAAAAFTVAGGVAFAGEGCSSSQVAQTKSKQVVASAEGGTTTPVVVPQQPGSGS